MVREGPPTREPPQRLRDHVTRNLEGYYGPENMRNVTFDLEGQEGDIWTGLGTVEVRDYLIFGERNPNLSGTSTRNGELPAFTRVQFRCHIDVRSGATNFHTRRMDETAAHDHGLVTDPSEVVLEGPAPPRSGRRRTPGGSTRGE